MLMAFIAAGRGVGASGAMTRLAAWVQHGLFPAAAESSSYFGKYFADGAHPLNDDVVFLVAGLIVGSFSPDLAPKNCQLVKLTVSNFCCEIFSAVGVKLVVAAITMDCEIAFRHEELSCPSIPKTSRQLPA